MRKAYVRPVPIVPPDRPEHGCRVQSHSVVTVDAVVWGVKVKGIALRTGLHRTITANVKDVAQMWRVAGADASRMRPKS